MEFTRLITFRIGLLAVILVIAWRMLVMGMSEYYVDRALAGDAQAVDKALSWNSSHPKALFMKAKQLIQEAPARAESLLQAVIRQNPADARAGVELALLLLARGETERADRLMEESVKLMPAFVPVRLTAANYWVQRKQWVKALDNWRAALVTDPSLGKQIFPVMLQIAESDQTRFLLKPLADEPPSWWEAFYRYLTENSSSLEPAVAIATMRQTSDSPLSVDERRYLVRRLKKEALWPEAYLVWANGLTDKQRRHLGSVYNGDFELDVTNEGFDWYFPNTKGVKARRQNSYGVEGQKGLHLIFKNREFRFQHLYQNLFLIAGDYEFRVKMRADRLRGRGGLRWAVICAGEGRQLLGESSRMLGTGEWQFINFKFSVPDEQTCLGQVLRLESTGYTTFDHKLEGEIWFDQASIRSSH